MDEDARRQANRENAKRSTGPRTPKGKARSSLNAIRHGALSARSLLPWEDPEELEELRRGFARALQPVGALETELVERLVSSAWRRRRVERVELGLWDWQGSVSQGRVSLPQVFASDCRTDQAIASICRYMSARDREFYRALETLTALREGGLFGADSSDDDDDASDPSDDDEGEGGNGSEGRVAASLGGDVDPGGTVDTGGGGDGGATATRLPYLDKGSEGSNPPEQRPPETSDAFAPGSGVGSDDPWESLGAADRARLVVGARRDLGSLEELVDDVLLHPVFLDRLRASHLLRLRKGLTTGMSDCSRYLAEVIDDLATTGGSASAETTRGSSALASRH